VQLQEHKERKARFERELEEMRQRLAAAELSEKHRALADAIEVCMPCIPRLKCSG
jgi:hypothetical protein